jgi:hypothetical protein
MLHHRESIYVTYAKNNKPSRHASTCSNSMANPNYMHMHIIYSRFCFAKQSQWQAQEIINTLKLPAGVKLIMLKTFYEN